MFRWLLRRELTREEAIRIATGFAVTKWREYTADWPAEEAGWRYHLAGASLGQHWWFVHFARAWPEGITGSDRGIDVWVHRATGEVDYGDVICEREKQKELDSEH